MRTYRILVTGSRETTVDEDNYVQRVLYLAVMNPLAEGRDVVIVEGRCPKGGVDLAAQRFAESARGVIDEPHPADWSKHGRGAGMIRNAEMVAAGADICVAFPAPDSRGTIDCLTKAWKAGIHTRVYPLRVRAGAQ